MEVSRTVPYDLVCLELGLEPLRFIIMRRRLLYLQKNTSLIKNLVKSQFKNLKKKDWGQTIMRDLNTLGIDFTLQEIEEMPEKRYKQLMKRKIKEHALKYLINKKERRNGKG